MGYRLFSNFPERFLDSTGTPLASGTVTFHLAGTTTLAAIYSDNTGTSASNPATLDANGQFSTAIWGDETIAYKITVKNSGGSTIGPVHDNVTIGNASTASDAQWITQSVTPTRLTNTTFSLATGDGDKTSDFHPGRRIKLTDSATLYGTIVKSNYNSTVANKTHVTVKDVLNSSGTATNLSASLTACALSLLTAKNPATPGDHVSVRQFGAVGDGVADDTAAVAKGITEALATGKPLYFPEGTYELTTWTAATVASKLVMFGDGIGKTILNGEGTQNFINFTNALVMRDMTLTNFEKIASGTPANGATSPVDEITVERCRIADSYAGIYLVGVGGDNIESGVERITIRDCKFEALERWALYATYKRQDIGVIDGCLFKDFEGLQSVQAVFWGYDVVVPAKRGHVSFTNNVVDTFLATYVGEAEVHAIMVHEAKSCYVAGNRIYNLQNSDTAGGDCEGIYIRTVEHAIVRDNVLVDVRAGVDALITVKDFCDYCEIIDNQIDNTTYAALDGNAGILSFAKHCIIRGNKITNVGGIGINVVHTEAPRIAVVENNWVENCGGPFGIFALCSTNSSITKNTVLNVKKNYATNVNFGDLTAYGSDACGIFFISYAASPARVAIDYNRVAVNVDVSNSPAYGIRCHAVTNLGNVSLFGNILDATTKDVELNVTGADVHSISTQNLGGYRVHQGLANQIGRFTMHDQLGDIGGGISYDHQNELFHILGDNGTTRVTMAAAGHFYPAGDNTQTLGKSGNRWSEIFCGNGTINTSDERQKQDVGQIDNKLMKAWAKVDYLQYKFKDSVEKKGNKARKHVGLSAQRVKEAFESEGLDPFEYGILCWDSWDDQYEPVTDSKGYAVLDENGQTVMRKIIEAGESYGIRYEQALALECAYLRSQLKK